MTLQEVRDKYLNRTYGLWDMVHGECQNARLTGIEAEDVLKALKEMYDSVDDCEMFCDGLLEEVDKLEQAVKKGKKVPPNLQTGKAAVFDTELCASDGYQYVLGILSTVHQKILERRCHQVKYDPRLTTKTMRDLEILSINREKLQFLKDAAIVNKKVMTEAVKDFEEMGNDCSIFFTEKDEEDKV